MQGLPCGIDTLHFEVKNPPDVVLREKNQNVRFPFVILFDILDILEYIIIILISGDFI